MFVDVETGATEKLSFALDGIFLLIGHQTGIDWSSSAIKTIGATCMSIT